MAVVHVVRAYLVGEQEAASIGIFFLMLSFSFVIASHLSDAYDREKVLIHQLSESLMKEKSATKEKKTTLPLLNMQPLVENALRHGILKKTDGGVFKLGVKAVIGGTLITVEDNGIGLTAEKYQNCLVTVPKCQVMAYSN